MTRVSSTVFKFAYKYKAVSLNDSMLDYDIQRSVYNGVMQDLGNEYYHKSMLGNSFNSNIGNRPTYIPVLVIIDREIIQQTEHPTGAQLAEPIKKQNNKLLLI